MPDDIICPRCGFGILVQDNQTHVFSCIGCNFKWKRNKQGEVEPIENYQSTTTLISENAIKIGSENMTENPTTIEVKEKDKPFILALSSVGLFVGEIIAVVYCYKENLPDAVSTLKEALTFTMGLLSMAWTYYLVKKNGNGKE